MEKATVLVVDNENKVLKVIENALGAISYDIILSKTGNEGLDRLKTDSIDIVLADQAMPDMTVLEFLKIVNQKHPDVITIMLADKIDLHTTIRAINEVGVYQFIQKPWNSFALRIHISRGLELKKMIAEKRRLLEKIEKNDAIFKQVAKKYPDVIRIIDQMVGENT